MKKVKAVNVKPGNKKTSRLVVCKRCRKPKKIHAKDLCRLCYAIVRNEKTRGRKDFQLT
jgi:hypothetical protein